MGKHAIVPPSRSQFKIAALAISMLLTACAGGPQSGPSAGTSNQAEHSEVLSEARLAAEAGELEYALDLLMPLAEKSEDPDLIRRSVQLAAAIEDWDRVTRAVARWREIEPGSSEALQFGVVAALRGGDLDRALELLRGGLIDSPDSREQQWDSVVTLLAMSPSIVDAGEMLEALLQDGAADRPGFADYQRSRLLWYFEEFERSFRLARRAWHDSGTLRDAVWAARLAEASGATDEAIDLWRAAIAIEPDSHEAQLGLAELLRETGHFDEALAVLQTMPPDPEILYNIGLMQMELDQPAQAGVTWQRLASTEPGRARARHAWLTGVLAELLQMNEAAVRWYEQVKGELEPRADLRRAMLISGMGRIDQARGLLESVRQTSGPELTEQAWLVEGQVLAEHGGHGPAMQVLSRALAEIPGSSALLYARAMAAVQADQLDLAEQDLRAIIQNDPENAEALNALGYTLSDRTDRQREAYRLIETALALAPDNPAVLDSMGWVLYRLGRAEEGLPYLRQAAEAEPHPEIVAHLIEVLYRTGREDEARARVLDSQEFLADRLYRETLERLGLE